MVDLRKDKLAPAALRVKYKSRSVEEFVQQFGQDIASGGIFVKTKKPVENGALLKFEFQLADGSAVLHGVGRVAWRRELAEASRTHAPPGMGIKFLKLDHETRATVERIVEGRGGAPSRFDHTEGAAFAPPSLAPGPTSAAPRAISAAPGLKPAPPRASGSSHPPPAPAAGALSTTGSSRSRRPSAPPISAPRPASERVAGLFGTAGAAVAKTPATPSSGDNPAHSSFFPRTPSGSRASSPAEQSAKASEFLATAFAEGGVATDTADQARAEAARARSSIPPSIPPPAEIRPSDASPDAWSPPSSASLELTEEHSVAPPPPAAAQGVAAGRSREESIDDLFAALEDSEAPPADEPSVAEAPAPEGWTTGSEESEPLPEPFLDPQTSDPRPGDIFALESDEEEFGEADLFGSSASIIAPAPDSEAPTAETPTNEVPVMLSLDEPEQVEEGTSPAIWLFAILALALLGGGAYYYLQMRGAATQAEPSVVAEPSDQEAPAEVPTEEVAAETGQAVAEGPAELEAAGAPEDAPAAAAGSDDELRVSVTTAPRGAELLVDGKVVARTPTTVPLPRGKELTLTVRSKGYATISQTLVVDDETSPIRFKLEPLDFSLVVVTQPLGATVSVGEQSVISPAPLLLGHLSGIVQVSIAKEGYQRMTRPVRLEEFTEQAGVMEATVEVSLSALPGTRAQRQTKRRPRRRSPEPSAEPPAPDEPAAAEPPPPPPAEAPPEAPPKPAAPEPNPFKE